MLQDSKTKVAILDGYNLLYRARYSARWQTPGPHTITYNFFRSLRKLLEDIDCEKIYFVLEGYPKARMEASPDYKGTREYEKDESYSLQKKEIIEILEKYFPVTLARHPDYECDDVIAHIAKEVHGKDEAIVVSTDTDFYQLFSLDNVKIYNPIKKSFVEKIDFDYVTWKALRGDSADNIHGFKGVGDKTALKLTNDTKLLREFLDKEEGRQDKFTHNHFMIKFHNLENLELLRFSKSTFDEKAALEEFKKFDFKSMVKEKPWKKFTDTFKDLK